MPFCWVAVEHARTLYIVHTNTDDVRLKVVKYSESVSNICAPSRQCVSFASVLNHTKQQRIPFSFDKTASISIVSSCITRLCHTICYYLCIKQPFFRITFIFGLCLVYNSHTLANNVDFWFISISLTVSNILMKMWSKLMWSHCAYTHLFGWHCRLVDAFVPVAVRANQM